MKKFILALTIAQSLWAAAPSELINSHIGKGILHYDKEAGLKDRCIDLKANQIFQEQSRITDYKLDLVSNKEELFDKISISASASGSYGPFSAKAKANFVREIKWNYNSNYVLVRAIRVTSKQNISSDKILLNKDSTNLLLTSKFKFLESCGSSFTNIVHFGGEIFGVVEIISDTYEKKTQIKNSLSASGSFGKGSASGSFSYERTLRELSQSYNLKLEFKHIGGDQLKAPTSIEELLTISKAIEENADANPVPIAIETREYSTLSNYVLDNDNYEVELRQNSIDYAEKKLKQARNLTAQIQYILENPNDFKKFDDELLKSKITYLDLKIEEIKSFIAKSYSFLNDSDYTTIDVDLNFNLPEMKNRAQRDFEKNGLKVTCAPAASQFCGVETYKDQKSSACGVRGVNEGTGPSCGSVFVEAATEYCSVKAYNIREGAVCGARTYKQCHHRDCGKNWDGSRKRCRTSACGVDKYKSCEDKSFGVAAYNSCRDERHGIEKYLTCKHKDFGYDFESCEHLSHGPETFKTCDVAKIGNQETYCPQF